MRLNNKGFAITTIVYGLSVMGILLVAILINTMATTRTNNRNMSKTVLDELSSFSKTEVVFENSSSLQRFSVPPDEGGWYRIELWGAQGDNGAGGLGAYTSGIISLKGNDILYFYVGNMRSGAGGEESDVRIVSGDGYDDKTSFETRIMVAAGGGKDPGSSGGTLIGYQNSMNGLGGYIDVKGEANTYNILTGSDNTKTTDTLIGLPKDYARTNITGMPVLSVLGINGGGDGYVPSNLSSVGGASFISGYGGCKAVVKGTRPVEDTPLYTYYPSTYEGSIGSYVYDEENGRNYFFVDGIMLPGVRKGNGMARIERLYEHEIDEKGAIVNDLPRKNHKLDSVRYIKDCLHKNNPADSIIWQGIEAIEKGSRVGFVSGSYDSSSGNYYCKTLDLGAVKTLDEIAVWHKDGIDYLNHTIEVSDGSSWKTVKKAAVDEAGNPLRSETETVSGIHISAYQFDNTVDLPNTGNYYLLPVTSENKVVSAKASGEDDGDPLSIEYITGEKRQKWSIGWLDNSSISPNPSSNREYKILELTRYKSMTVLMDENLTTNRIVANSGFNNYSRNEPQIWKIIPLGNGTYQIITVVPAFDAAHMSGNIIPQTNIDSLDFYDNVIIGKKNLVTARFKLISVDYA